MSSSENSFVDYAPVAVSGGDGGSGYISFRREKHVPYGGPDGGDGGKGGDVWFVADRSLLTLLDVKHRSHFSAGHGEHGGPKNMSGHGGADVVVRVPVGTQISDDRGHTLADLVEHGQKFQAAAGGMGGPGNQHYATPTNQAPRKVKDGKPGERRRLVLELKMIADAGFVGLPNAGKSTLLRALTRATPKVAAYPFTTLHPNLGILELDDYRRVTLADIPGLIEGASRGVGLGDRFLRHIERTALLVHLVAPPDQLIEFDESDDEASEIGAGFALDAYRLVRMELLAYSKEFERKPELVVLTKIDLLSDRRRAVMLRRFAEEGLAPLPISAETGEGIDALREAIERRLEAMGRLESHERSLHQKEAAEAALAEMEAKADRAEAGDSGVPSGDLRPV